MSVSTDGHISFGILLDEDFELPWYDEDGEGEIEAWWYKETGYVPPFELYSETGSGYAPGIETVKDRYGQDSLKDTTLRESYFAAQREWDKSHPLPVEMVNTCSGDHPVWIAAVPGTRQWAGRGYPIKFNPDDLVVDETALAAFTAFCAKYGIDGEPAWYLGSYWG